MNACPNNAAAGTGAGAGSIKLRWLQRRREDGRQPLLDLLGQELGLHAEQVVLVDDTYGKPQLIHPVCSLRFNWSHCQELALVAMTHEAVDLGVDVERCDRRVNVQALAARYFDASEVALVQAADAIVSRSRFLAIWTAKEAVLKALGRGLAYGIDRVVIGLDGDLPVLRSVDGQPARDQAWHLLSLVPPQPGWIAALAWQGPPLTLSSDDTCSI